jgi:hypothetical protein
MIRERTLHHASSKIAAVVSATIVLAFVLTGCGGGKSEQTGRAEFRILWPQDVSRLIPAASNSVSVTLRLGTEVVATKVSPRPAAGASALVVFDNLPLGEVTATGSAHPNADGTGQAQAAGSVTFQIQAGQTTAFSITLASTIDHLELTPPAVTLNPAEEQTLSVAAKDTAGSIVLLAPSKLSWSTSAGGVATVDSAGKVRGIAGGTAQITVTDTESGKTAGATITVRSTAPGGPITMSQVVTYPVPVAADRVLAGDLDGDGNADVVVSAEQLVILYGRGDGTLEPFQSITTWSPGLWAADLADMNGDGRLDIICAAAPDKVFIVHNTGGRTFSTPLQIPVGGRTYPKAGDINADGMVDLAVLVDNGGPSKPIVILLNNSAGFTNAASYDAPQFAGGITLGDFTGDGKLDIADGFWSSTGGQGGIHTLIGVGNGTFTSGPGFTTGEPGNSPLIADFTGDGRVDLVINNYWSHNIAILPGQGGLNFGPLAAYIAAPYPLVMEAADFNGDGLLDIAAGNAGSTHVSILRSQGANGFADTLYFEAGGGDVRSVDLADFNKDGKMDIVTQNQSNATVGILLNTTP